MNQALLAVLLILFSVETVALKNPHPKTNYITVPLNEALQAVRHIAENDDGCAEEKTLDFFVKEDTSLAPLMASEVMFGSAFPGLAEQVKEQIGVLKTNVQKFAASCLSAKSQEKVDLVLECFNQTDKEIQHACFKI